MAAGLPSRGLAWLHDSLVGACVGQVWRFALLQRSGVRGHSCGALCATTGRCPVQTIVGCVRRHPVGRALLVLRQGSFCCSSAARVVVPRGCGLELSSADNQRTAQIQRDGGAGGQDPAHGGLLVDLLMHGAGLARLIQAKALSPCVAGANDDDALTRRFLLDGIVEVMILALHLSSFGGNTSSL
jgi:hypothetical protein